MHWYRCLRSHRTNGDKVSWRINHISKKSELKVQTTETQQNGSRKPNCVCGMYSMRVWMALYALLQVNLSPNHSRHMLKFVQRNRLLEAFTVWYKHINNMYWILFLYEYIIYHCELSYTLMYAFSPCSPRSILFQKRSLRIWKIYTAAFGVKQTTARDFCFPRACQN